MHTVCVFKTRNKNPFSLLFHLIAWFFCYFHYWENRKYNNQILWFYSLDSSNMYNNGTGILGSFFACSQYLKVDSHSDIVKQKLKTYNSKSYKILSIFTFIYMYLSVRKFCQNKAYSLWSTNNLSFLPIWFVKIEVWPWTLWYIQWLYTRFNSFFNKKLFIV